MSGPVVKKPHLTKDGKKMQNWELRSFGGPWTITEYQQELLLGHRLCRIVHYIQQIREVTRKKVFPNG